jgi:CHAT domain-containing protein/Tfp pilus assembly protein PilF
MKTLFALAALLISILAFEPVFAQSRKEMVDSAYTYIEKRDLKRAMVFAEKALELSEKEFGKKSDFYAKALDLVGHVQNYSGNYESAIEWYEKASAVKREALSKDDPSLATTLNNISYCYQKLGLYRQAQPALEEALEIKRKTVGENDTSYATSLHNLGQLYISSAEYEKAEQIYIQALDIKRKQYGETHPSIAKSLVNLGIVYLKLGNFPKAEPLFEQAIEILKKSGKSEDIESISISLQLADIYLKLGKNAEAEKILTQSRNLKNFSGETAQIDYANVLYNLAIIDWSQKNYASAAKLLEDAYSAMEQHTAHPLFADILNGLGILYSYTGKLEQSLEFLQNAVELRKQLYGVRHPDYATAIHNLAGVEKSMGKYEQAESHYREAFRLYIQQIHDYFPFLSESEKSQFYFNIKERFDLFNCYVLQRWRDNPAIAADMCDFQIATKSLLLSSSLKVRNTIHSSGKKELIEKFEQWRSLREELARLYRMSGAELKQSKKNIAELENKANALEKEISKQCSIFNEIYNQKHITWRDIQKTLESDEAVVEIVRFNFFDQGWTDSVYYAFLIITKETTKYPELVIISNGYDLERLYINGYRNKIRHELFDEEPYMQFWAEVDKKLQGKTRVYVSQDGVYNKINLSTLMNNEGDYLIDKSNIVVISNSSDLLEIKAKKATPKLKNAALFGFPKFDLKLNPDSAPAKPRQDKAKLIIPELPGTAEEVSLISNLFKTKNIPFETFLVERATTAALKQMKSPSVLHIATHGYFDRDVDHSNKGIFSSSYKSFGDNNNPLFRSYLLFAGAENSLNSRDTSFLTTDDGLLTAYDAMNLNLDETALVVLSACETGLGEIKNGEGVYGLQRSFRAAGAKAVIMSLWTVNDLTTQELMVEFYKNWLGGEKLGEAFKKAQLALREKYSQPYYWGAFVLVGDTD